MFPMEKNMADWDRVVRIILAVLGIAGLAVGIYSGVVGYAIIAVALIFILTSIVGFCPIYWLINFSTKTMAFGTPKKGISKKKK